MIAKNCGHADLAAKKLKKKVLTGKKNIALWHPENFSEKLYAIKYVRGLH